MTARPLLLLVGDDVGVRDQWNLALASEYQVIEAAERVGALSQIRLAMPPLVLLDLGFLSQKNGTSEGLALLREAIHVNPTAKVIAVTDSNDTTSAFTAIESGAYDVLHRPVQLDVLKVVLQRATFLSTLEREKLAFQVQTGETQFEGLVGNSLPMHDVFGTIRRVAPSDVSVLITGESGTGKELVARAIHRLSGRNAAPFVAINCGAIPESLLESELFGHEKGAFTGAVQQRKGRIESALGGTLLLDEIGDIPLNLQVKLLRFLQNHEIHRLGGTDTISVDVRVLAATNSDLYAAIESGRFREDLYYRICVVTIPVPTLKARGADITLLARTFLKKFTESHNKTLKGFTPQAIDALLTHDWPGNVRELENRVKRAVVMAEGKHVSPAHLELKDPCSAETESMRLRVARDLREKELVKVVLEKTNGNVSKAALELGISRPTLYQLLSRYGLRQTRFTGNLEK